MILVLTEDEIVLIEHLPGRRVHLQDFFWTGVDDAPSWLDPDQALNFYETRTVHHTSTVYVNGENGEKNDGKSSGEHQNPGCISCIEPTPTLVDPDQNIGVLVGDDPGPRYWLLTVLKAGESVPSKVELRLARLYRAAFYRQQQRHLGLLSTDPRLRRATKRRSTLDGHKSLTKTSTDNNGKNLNRGLSTTDTTTLISELSTTSNILNETTTGKRMRQIKIIKDESIKKNYLNYDEKLSNQKFDGSAPSSNFKYDEGDIVPTELSTITPIVLKKFDNKELNGRSTKNEEISGILNLSRYRNAADPQSLRSNSEFYPDFTIDESDELNTLNTTSPNIFIHNNKVNIKTINISDNYSEEITEEYNNTSNNLINRTGISSTNSRLRTAGIGIVQVRMQNTTILNDGSTCLIYSVHLGGKPVPAETAAKDMALLSPQEVALELGAPVIVQSEPYLKETRPLALSRKRDVWLLLGASSLGLAFLIIVIAVLVITAKRKRAHSAVSVPPTQGILKKERGYAPTTSGLENTGYTSETEERTDGISQRQSPVSESRTTPNTPVTIDDEIQELSSDNDEELVKKNIQENWDIEDYSTVKKKSRTGGRRVKRINTVDSPKSPDSMDTVVECHGQGETIDNGCVHTLDETASPYSYLSMPSCKLFPSMRTVEPLSRILEPVVIRHLDMEFETPEMSRRENGFAQRKSSRVESLTRTRSALKDPGVVGPIVWDLRRQHATEEHTILGTDVERQLPSSGPVGRARRRLHELLEDSFNLFSARDIKTKENVVSSSLRPISVAISPDPVTIFSESKETFAHVSSAESPTNFSKIRPRTSLSRNGLEKVITETGNTGQPSRSTWGTRPMSAGPFHRPNLPEVNVTRILTDSHLTPDDPAVPLIAAIKKELDKFTPQISQT